MQLSFGDAEGTGKRKKTRREIFLAEMEQVVPWTALLALIVPHYPRMGQRGRQPYAVATENPGQRGLSDVAIAVLEAKLLHAAWKPAKPGSESEVPPRFCH